MTTTAETSLNIIAPPLVPRFPDFFERWCSEHLLPTPLQVDASCTTDWSNQGEITPANSRNHRSRAAIRVASLNIKGYSTADDPNPDGKWQRCARVIKANKIAVLAIQESHMDEARCAHLNALYSK